MFHLPTNHRHKGLEIEEFARLVCHDLLENTYPNDRVSEERALTIMDRQHSNQGGQIPSTVNALTPAEADALTTLSTLSKSIPSSDERYANAHPLGISSDDTYHEVRCSLSGKVRSGKRKQRGKCTECGTSTQYYCMTCDPGPGRCHHWCCPDMSGNNNKWMCHTNHKTKHGKTD